MASCSEIERWLSILGTGIAGLRLLRDFGLQSYELEFFRNNFGKGEMQILAFAPSIFRNQYEPRLEKAKLKVIEGVRKLADTNLPDEAVESILTDTKELYALLNDLRQVVMSGVIII